ncbi:LysR family transcriptional regulator [Klebsiella variicola]
MNIARKLGSITQLEVFIKIVEHGNLSHAAKELNLSPSAVSKNISLLEERLGTVLLIRTTRSVSLTQHGRIMFDRAKSILRSIDDAFEASLCFQKPHGTLRLTCSVALGCAQIHRLVHEYQQIYPEVTVSIDLNDKICNLNDNEYDLAIRVTTGDTWNYKSIFLGDVSWVYCCSPEYVQLKGLIDHPQQLEKHVCLTYPNMTHGGKWIFQNETEQISIDISPAVTCNSSLFLLSSTLEGNGISCLPNYLADKYIKEKKLEVVLPQYTPLLHHKLYALSIKSMHNHPLIKTFIEHLKDNIIL